MTQRPFRRATSTLILCAALVATTGCTGVTTKRVTGQNERFMIDPNTFVLRSTLPAHNGDPLLHNDLRENTRAIVDAKFGDLIRYDDDVVTLQVVSVHLQSIPYTLLASRDVIVFAEVWENGASGYSATPLNSIIHIAKNQMIPGRMSFEGNIAYGPTRFKGHPLKIRFTVMVLQKEKGREAGTAADVIGNFTTAATLATPYSQISSSMVGLIRELLRSQPDVIAMDYEFTDLGHSPESLLPTIFSTSAQGEAGRGPASVSLADATPSQLIVKATEVRAALSVSGRNTSELDTRRATLETAIAGIKSEMNTAIASAAQTPTAAVQLMRIQQGLDKGEPTPIWDQDIVAVCDALEGVCRAEGVSPELAAEIRSVIASANQTLVASERLRSELERINWKYTITSLERQWSWLRYGMYAIVETEQRRTSVQQMSDDMGNPRPRRKPFQLDDEVYFDRGWLRHAGDRQGDLVETNYLVFALTPRQLPQLDEVLLAASRADAQLLASLRQSGGDIASAADGVQSFSRSVLRAIAEERAASVARSVAVRLERTGNESKFAETFNKAFEEAFDGIDRANFGKNTESGVQWLAALQSRLSQKWTSRFIKPN